MQPVIQKFSKTAITQAQANQVAADHRADGAVSSVVTEDNENFIVTTMLAAPAGDDPTPHTAAAATGHAASGPAKPAAAGGGPYVAANPSAFEGKAVGSGQCVAYVQTACRAPLTKNWRRGIPVKGNAATVREGTAIATFDANGAYGNHTDGTSHAAVYLGQDGHGLWVYDQWQHHPMEKRHVMFDDARPPANDGNKFYVIM